MRRMDAGGYSACFDHQQLALMCANSDRTIDRLGAENKQLKAENAKLRELMYERAHVYAIQNMTEDELRITATNVMEDNAKLRELCADMWEAVKTHKRINFAQLLRFGERVSELEIEVPS